MRWGPKDQPGQRPTVQLREGGGDLSDDTMVGMTRRNRWKWSPTCRRRASDRVTPMGLEAEVEPQLQASEMKPGCQGTEDRGETGEKAEPYGAKGVERWKAVDGSEVAQAE